SGGSPAPTLNPQLSEGTREIILERSFSMKKDIKFSTRMASADREKIRALAAKAHMSMSDCVTACCLGKRIVVIDEQKELLRQLKGIGSNINRLTVLANMDKVQVIGLEKATGELSEVSAALRSVKEGR
ncbi:MobC family plasmid mobilization relaxosome protein, partial [Dysosmobacter sp.]|uniref:MobC family plasmid mobilization relaxosome protein n=1 Tax=Dysosmobacter sp. TaxID=2591382 RepID=UPI003AB361CC